MESGQGARALEAEGEHVDPRQEDQDPDSQKDEADEIPDGFHLNQGQPDGLHRRSAPLPRIGQKRNISLPGKSQSGLKLTV
jgi:hypothetical protein